MARAGLRELRLLKSSSPVAPRQDSRAHARVRLGLAGVDRANDAGEAFGLPVAERQGYLAEAFQKAQSTSKARRRTGSEIVAFFVRASDRVTFPANIRGVSRLLVGKLRANQRGHFLLKRMELHAIAPGVCK